jgi:hypothetical protein
MCEPISIGIAIGAATGAIGAAATGQDVFKGALMGGIMGGVTGGMGGLGAGGAASTIGSNLGTQSFFSAINTVLPATLSSQALVGFAATSLVGSVAMGMMAPEEYTAEAWDYSPIAYNSQENQVTGSGGAQASAVLADEIKTAKAKRAKQAQPKQDSYVNTESFANSGLQLA